MIYHQCHERHFPGIHIQYTPFLALTCLPPFLWKYVDTKLMFHSQALITNAVEHMAILVGQSTQSRLQGDSESMSWVPFPNNNP
jgi:hypothetical protein